MLHKLYLFATCEAKHPEGITRLCRSSLFCTWIITDFSDRTNCDDLDSPNPAVSQLHM